MKRNLIILGMVAVSIIATATAANAVDSRGTLVADTWRDQQSFGSIGRTIAVTPPISGKAAVQFVYMEKASGSAAHTPLWAWLAYDASVGAFIAPGGRKIGQCADTASSCTHYGLYPQITVDPTGIAYVSGNDFNAGNGQIRYHTIRDSALLQGRFGYINDGSIRQATDIEWPKIDMTDFGGTPTFYQSATLDGVLSVYRKAGWSSSTNDISWQLVYADSAIDGGHDIVCERSGQRVVVAYLKPSPNGGSDIWYASSTDGTIWSATNVTQYAGNGYRAWHEVSTLIDTQGKLHLLWNSGVWVDIDYDLWKSRLFHWSEWNSATITPVYSALWDTLVSSYYPAPGLLNIAHVSLSECDNRLFALFTGFYAPLAGHSDDGSVETSSRYANGEIFVSVSSDVEGTGWWQAHNLTESYAPDCMSGDCADDRLMGVTRFGMDEADYPVNNWMEAETYVLDNGTPNGKYLHLFYLSDRLPGYAGTSTALTTLNDLRWIRLACTAPIPRCQLASNVYKIDHVIDFDSALSTTEIPITLENFCSEQMTILSVTPFEDSSTAPVLPGWLGTTGSAATIPGGDSTQFVIRVNQGELIKNPGTYYGRIVIQYSPSASPFTIPVRVRASGKGSLHPPFAVWDTLTTQCGLKLAVSNFGSMGNDYAGGANLNFPQPSPECDTNGGNNNAGDASIYLGAASPIIVRKTGVDSYAASWGIYSDDTAYSHTFKPMAESPTAGPISGTGYEGFNSGVFCSADSSVKLQVTWYAPTGPTNADSCKFMIQRMKIYPFTPGVSVPNLAIGQLFDWDIPTDTSAPLNVGNVAFTDPTRRLVGMRGFTSVDTSISNHNCYLNAHRYGGAALITMHMKNVVQSTVLYGAYNGAIDSFVFPAGGLLPEQLWANMQSTGYSNESRIADLHSMLTYKNGASNAGWTLPANDTLTIWTAIAATRPTGGTTAQGLDSLKKEIDKAFKWYEKVRPPVLSCCYFARGNVISSAWTTPNLSDLSYLIAYLTLTPRPTIYCFLEADVNGSGTIDLSDLSLLIAFMTETPRPTLPNCPF